MSFVRSRPSEAASFLVQPSGGRRTGMTPSDMGKVLDMIRQLGRLLLAIVELTERR